VIPGFSVAGQIVFGLACLLFGAWFAHFCIRAWRRARAAPSWVRVPGRIVSAIVVPDDNNYAPLVRYTYNVGGTQYRSSQIALTYTSYFRERQAQAAIDRYRPGREVMVSVDPDDPAQAILEPGSGAAAFALFGALALALAAFGLYALAAVLAAATAA
jgi:hypothetical protein